MEEDEMNRTNEQKAAHAAKERTRRARIKAVKAPPSDKAFSGLLAEADKANEQRAFERETSHLPGAMDEGIKLYGAMIRDHHAAMLAADEQEAMRLRKEAHLLATKLNGGRAGILADEESPGCVLARETAAQPGDVPLWGQSGDFVVEAAGTRARITMDGMFGLGSEYAQMPSFEAHVVDHDKPFISETGYRSFVGLQATLVPGVTPDAFARAAIERHVATELKGKLRALGAAPTTPRKATEATMKKSVKKPASAPKVQPAKTSGKGKTKNEIMLDMICRKRGATEAEICEQIGWKACLVTLKRAAEKFAVKLTSEKDKATNRNRYFGARA
jgi:hypothetical protein